MLLRGGTGNQTGRPGPVTPRKIQRMNQQVGIRQSKRDASAQAGANYHASLGGFDLATCTWISQVIETAIDAGIQTGVLKRNLKLRTARTRTRAHTHTHTHTRRIHGCLHE